MYCVRIGLSGAKKFQATPLRRRLLVSLGGCFPSTDPPPLFFIWQSPPLPPGLQCLSLICSCFETTNSMSWRTLHLRIVEFEYLPFQRLDFLMFTSSPWTQYIFVVIFFFGNLKIQDLPSVAGNTLIEVRKTASIFTILMPCWKRICRRSF